MKEPIVHDIQKEHAGLMLKLAAVIEETGKIEKKGHNTFHNYDYATETDIVEGIRKSLSKNKIFILPSVTDTKSELVDTKAGKAYQNVVEMLFEIGDAETGYYMKSKFTGISIDNGDKGIYKAYTGAVKYFLLKTFLIPTGDDPEKDSPQISHPSAPNNPVTHTATHAVKPMSMPQTNLITTLLKVKGKDEVEFKAFVKTLFRLEDPYKMNMQQASIVIGKLQTMPDKVAQVEDPEIEKAIDKMAEQKENK